MVQLFKYNSVILYIMDIYRLVNHVLTIKCFTNKTEKKMTFTEENNVKDIKDMISQEDIFGSPPCDKQYLSFNGISLQDEWKLRYSWLDGKIIHLVVI